MESIVEPSTKRAIAFFDGQNLYHAAREAFGHGWPKYDPKALAEAICAKEGWQFRGARFYTGVPAAAEDPFWSGWWSKKLLAVTRSGVLVTRRDLKYRDKEIDIGDGCILTRRIGEEKGIDVRIAVDLLRLTNEQHMDVAIVFSQDQDLVEATDEAKRIAKQQGRWFKVVCPYPVSGRYLNRRGIDRTDWWPMDGLFYEAHCDDRDYRP